MIETISGYNAFEQAFVYSMLGLWLVGVMWLTISAACRVGAWVRERRRQHDERAAANKAALQCKHGRSKLTTSCHDCAVEWAETYTEPTITAPNKPPDHPCIFCDTRPAVGEVCREHWDADNKSTSAALNLLGHIGSSHCYKPPGLFLAQGTTYKDKLLWPHKDDYDPSKPEHRLEIIVRMFAIDHDMSFSPNVSPAESYNVLNKSRFMWFYQPIDSKKVML